MIKYRFNTGAGQSQTAYFTDYEALQAASEEFHATWPNGTTEYISENADPEADSVIDESPF